MKNLQTYLKGDLAIWAIVLGLAIFSFMPVYSASTNLVYVAHNGTTSGHLIKHFMLLLLGFIIIYATHKVPYKYFSAGSVIMLPLVMGLLFFTLLKGKTIGGENASRWIQIPFVGVGFQTSTLAGVILMMYVSRFLAKHKNKLITFKDSLWQLWLPVAITLLLILPANFSTTAILFFLILTVAFIGGYPKKQLLYIIGMGTLVLTLFILTVMAFPKLMPNRVGTWKSRIENFSSSSEEGYQVEKAKIAIATGGLNGIGPGKSIQKNFLPQSSSDFIFAIIVEEFGLIVAALLLFAYLLLFFRFMMVSKKAPSIFGMLLVIGVGFPIIFQALINMAVAVNLFPVTGQTLPLISSGGTSIWMTCFAIGIILSVSASKEGELENKDIEENPLDVLQQAL